MEEFICKKCNKSYKSQKSLNYHIQKYHPVLCDYKCEKCEKTYLTEKGLKSHYALTHQIYAQEYYDIFYKKEGEGICPVCGKETNFNHRNNTYYKHCSTICINKNPETLEKIRKTKLARFGVENNTQLDYYKKLNSDIWKNKSKEELETIKMKTKETCLEKYGVDNPAKLEKFKNKSKETCLEKYGTEYSLSSDIVIQKRKETNLEKYGVENVFQNKEIQEKIKKKLEDLGYHFKTDEEYSDVENYQRECVSYTNKTLRKYNFREKWDGYDYYDGEYIKENYEKYKPNNENYPNIDHKISISFGFNNNIDAEKISELSNLCITKRKHNVAKSNKNEKEYKKILESRK